jgi:hypothetical protein
MALTKSLDSNESVFADCCRDLRQGQQREEPGREPVVGERHPQLLRDEGWTEACHGRTPAGVHAGHGCNPDAGFLATDVSPTSTTKTEVLDAVKYDWALFVAPINWSIADEAKNTGEKKVDLVTSLVDNGLNSHDDQFEAGLFAASATNGFLSLPVILTRTAGHHRWCQFRDRHLLGEQVQRLRHGPASGSAHRDGEVRQGQRRRDPQPVCHGSDAVGDLRGLAAGEPPVHRPRRWMPACRRCSSRAGLHLQPQIHERHRRLRVLHQHEAKLKSVCDQELLSPAPVGDRTAERGHDDDEGRLDGSVGQRGSQPQRSGVHVIG